MDEPLSNLDAKLRNDMRAELKRLHQSTGATFVYVTHDQLEAMTLSTKICLMKLGVLQQYSTPLELYGKPANLFTADFVGNPSINLIPMEGKLENGEVKLAHKDVKLTFCPNEEITLPASGKVVLGVRPEFLKQQDHNSIQATVESSLPSGMETILVTTRGDLRLTSVIFGDVDYKTGEVLNMGFDGGKYQLFDGDTGLRLTSGSVRV